MSSVRLLCDPCLSFFTRKHFLSFPLHRYAEMHVKMDGIISILGLITLIVDGISSEGVYGKSIGSIVTLEKHST